MIDGIPAPGPSIFTILGHYWSEVFPLHLRTFFFLDETMWSSCHCRKFKVHTISSSAETWHGQFLQLIGPLEEKKIHFEMGRGNPGDGKSPFFCWWWCDDPIFGWDKHISEPLFWLISHDIATYDQILYDHVNDHGCHGLQVTWGSGSSIVSQRRWWAWPSWNRKENVRRERPWTSTRHGSTSSITGENASRHRRGGNRELQAILEEFFFFLRGICIYTYKYTHIYIYIYMYVCM